MTSGTTNSQDSPMQLPIPTGTNSDRHSNAALSAITNDLSITVVHDQLTKDKDALKPLFKEWLQIAFEWSLNPNHQQSEHLSERCAKLVNSMEQMHFNSTLNMLHQWLRQQANDTQTQIDHRRGA